MITYCTTMLFHESTSQFSHHECIMNRYVGLVNRLNLHIFIFLATHRALSDCLSIYSSLHPSVCLSVYRFVNLSICLVFPLFLSVLKFVSLQTSACTIHHHHINTLFCLFAVQSYIFFRFPSSF